MVELIQRYGDIKLQKRKKENNYPDARKNFRAFFCPLRFLKIVTNVTKLFA